MQVDEHDHGRTQLSCECGASFLLYDGPPPDTEVRCVATGAQSEQSKQSLNQSVIA